jgi:CxxC-x17-CxxC domain-containing protein
VALEDKILTCADCGASFVFTAGEQEFHSSRGFSDPRRCPDCRAARKAASGGGDRRSGGGGGGGGYGGGGGGTREMFTATCATCGREARVPFQPRGDRPVYCSDCYTPPARSTGGGGGAGRGRSSGGGGGGSRW